MGHRTIVLIKTIMYMLYFLKEIAIIKLHTLNCISHLTSKTCIIVIYHYYCIVVLSPFAVCSMHVEGLLLINMILHAVDYLGSLSQCRVDGTLA